MKKIGYLCITLALLAGISPNSASAGGGHHYHYPYAGRAFALGLGYWGGWGPGYYGRFPMPLIMDIRLHMAMASGVWIHALWVRTPPYGYAPAYTYPPVVAAPSAPSVVVQQQPRAALPPPPTPSANYWYYCRKPDGYYPYVRNCPGGWLQVVPQPPQ